MLSSWHYECLDQPVCKCIDSSNNKFAKVWNLNIILAGFHMGAPWSKNPNIKTTNMRSEESLYSSDFQTFITLLTIFHEYSLAYIYYRVPTAADIPLKQPEHVNASKPLLKQTLNLEVSTATVYI